MIIGPDKPRGHIPRVAWDAAGWAPHTHAVSTREGSQPPTLQLSRGFAQGSPLLDFDPDFKGPVKLRKTTDALWCAAFAVIWCLGLAPLGGFVLITGNPKSLVYGRDSNGLMCGVDADVAERLELLRPDAYDPSVRVCVRTCPAAAEQMCVVSGALADSPQDACPGALYLMQFSTEPIYHRCLPVDADESEAAAVAWETLSPEVDKPHVVLASMAADVVYAMPSIALCLLAAWLLCMIMGKLLERSAVTFVGLTTMVSLSGLASLSSILLDGKQTVALANRTDTRLEAARRAQHFVSACAFAAVTCGAFLMAYLVARRKSLRTSVILLRCSSRAICQLGALVAVALPVICVLSALVVYAFAVPVFAAAVMQFSPDAALQRVLPGLLVAFAYGMLASVSFVVSTMRYTAAVLVASWYWTPKSTEPPPHLVRETALGVGMHHLGSVAKHALAAPLLGPVQMVASCTSRKLTSDTVQGMHSIAYPQMAMHCTPYSQAALKAFQLLQRNENLVGAAEGAATGFVGLAQAALCCVCPLLLLVCLSNYPDINTANVQNAMGPLLAMFALSSCASYTCLVLYVTSLRTLIQCFCEDMERNNGSPLRPYHMPHDLRDLLLEHQSEVKSRTSAPQECAGAITNPPPLSTSVASVQLRGKELPRGVSEDWVPKRQT